MEHPLIKINIDDAQAITRLQGIGNNLAERIVQYRAENGFFKEPADLAKVKGVSLQLAETLSPQIDWEIPTESVQEDKTDQLGLTDLIFCVFFMGATIYIIYSYILGSFLYQKKYWYEIWIDCSFVAGLLVGALSFIFAAIELYVVNVPLKRKFALIRFTLWGGLIVTIISIGLGNFFKYQVIGWNELLQDTSAIVGGLAATAVTLYILFILITVKNPSLINNKYFIRFFDIVFLLNSVLYLLASIYQPAHSPVLISLILGFFGILYGYIGIESIRKNKTFLTFLIGPWLSQLNNNENSQSGWLKWINSRLPDPESQKALQKALNQAYPTSKLRTFFSLLIIGIGGWIILQAIGAIIQWAVGKGLDKIFGDIFN